MNESGPGAPGQKGGVIAKARQHAVRIKWCSIGVIVVALLWTARTLPVDRGVEQINAWVQDLGFWGPVVFGLVYIVAAVLLLPASALTLAAGAVFGLVKGAVTVSLASTTAAAFAFLIARYLARQKMVRFARKSPKFDAIDQAISERGWKIVALLRLSPAVPFNVQNYLYGVTGIRFWTCVLTSWVAMLPGTFMYIYLGHLGGQGLGVATGAGTGKSAGEWAILIVGFVATAAVTVYIARIASAAIGRGTQIAGQPVEESESAAGGESGRSSTPQAWPWGAVLSALLAVLAVSGAVAAHFNPQMIQGLFPGAPGPTATPQFASRGFQPARTTAQAEACGSRTHSKFDALLKRHVDSDGWVDYQAIAADPTPLDEYIVLLANAPFDDLGRNEKLALLINAYNAFTIRLILDHWDDGRLKSIKNIPAGKRWEAKRWRIGSRDLSLNQIEHQQIRPNFKEPRIHFALVCAAVGCPRLLNAAYQADRIEEQLEDQTRRVHGRGRWFRFNEDTGVVYLTRLYKWYGGDFKQVAGSVLEYAARFSQELRSALDAGRKLRVKWLDYDWRLNDRVNRP